MSIVNHDHPHIAPEERNLDGDEYPQRGKMSIVKHDHSHIAPEERNLDGDEYPQRGKMLIVKHVHLHIAPEERNLCREYVFRFRLKLMENIVA